MSAKPTKRNWNDVQTAIATAAIVTTLGMWNLFSAPAKASTAQADQPTLPPTDPPTQPPVSPATAASLPYVKIIFTPGAPQVQAPAVAQQPQLQAPQVKRKRSGGGGGGGGGGGSSGGSSAPKPVTKTKSS